MIFSLFLHYAINAPPASLEDRKSERLCHLCPCIVLSLLALLPSAAGAMGPLMPLHEDFTTLSAPGGQWRTLASAGLS